jgi:peptidoglycan-associated lipoprotein
MAMFAVAACLTVTVTGCAADPAPVRVQVPIVTAAEVKPMPKVAPVMTNVSPNVNVADELVASCKLRFNNVDNTPRFEFDRSDLLAADNDVLAQIAQCITTGPLAGAGLDLVGRADPRGASTYNAALGDRRASSVRTALTNSGVDAGVIGATSRGELDAMGTDEAGWQRDRRVDILLH